MPVLLAEQHVQDWTSAQILAALRRRGYAVRDWHQTQDTEKFVPADWLFMDRTRLKVFGLQYKALYRNGTEYWPLDESQHATLARYPWIVYCASELTAVTEKGQSLSMARFYGVDFPYQPRLRRRIRRPKYLRWREFIRGFESCLFGHRVTTKAELRSLVGEVSGSGPVREVNQTIEYLFLNLERRRALRLRTGR
jgi:hypothetical protein